MNSFRSKHYPREYVVAHCKHCNTDTEQWHERRYTAVCNDITGLPVYEVDVVYQHCTVCNHTVSENVLGAGNERA